MWFLDQHPVTLEELLLAPLLARETLSVLRDVPLVSRALLDDLAEAWGHRRSRVRAALSHLLATGSIVVDERDGESCLRVGTLAGPAPLIARARPPEGFVLAVVATDDARDRRAQDARETLALQGFRMLAPHVFLHGALDTTTVEATLRKSRLADHVIIFRCSADASASLQPRLLELFGLARRARELARFERDLNAFLNELGLSELELARRYLAAVPAFHRVTFVEEPPLPLQWLPDDYPLRRLLTFAQPSGRRALALRRYFLSFEDL